MYSISISHQKVGIENGIEENYDVDSAALSVIEQLIFTQKNCILESIKPYLVFDSESQQVREIGIKLLNSIIINCKLEEQEIFNFLEVIVVHINDPIARVKEASLWALHAICYKKILPLEVVKTFCEKNDCVLFEVLLSFLTEISDDDSSNLAAISCEILSLFVINNVDGCFQSIFDIFFQIVSELQKMNSDSNLAFVQIRIEKVLLKICSNHYEQEDLIHYVLSTLSSYLNQVLHLNLKQSDNLIDFHSFLCEMIDQFLQNNIFCSSSFNFENFQDLIQDLMNELVEFVSKNSISALTSLFISFGDFTSSQLSVLFQLYESFQNDSVDSLVRYSIHQSNYSLIEQFWEIIEDKHSSFFVPLIEYIEINSVNLNESNIQIFEKLFDPLFLNDFLTILEIIISNSETADCWIKFGFQIINSLKQQQSINEQKIEEIFQENIKSIINFFQSSEVSNIQLCRDLLTDLDLMYILNYALTDPEVALESESIIVVLKEV